MNRAWDQRKRGERLVTTEMGITSNGEWVIGLGLAGTTTQDTLGIPEIHGTTRGGTGMTTTGKVGCGAMTNSAGTDTNTQ